MKKYLLPTLLLGLGFILILGALGVWLHTRAGSAFQKELLPPSLGGLPLNQTVSGPEAITGISQLHGINFPMTDAAIGFYGLESQISVWVSVTPSEDRAREQITSMTANINQGDTPFTPPISSEIDGITVYALEDFEQQHYYWQVEELVIWLATDFDLVQEAFGQTFEYYR